MSLTDLAELARPPKACKPQALVTDLARVKRRLDNPLYCDWGFNNSRTRGEGVNESAKDN